MPDLQELTSDKSTAETDTASQSTTETPSTDKSTTMPETIHVTRTIIERERAIQRFYGDEPSLCAQFAEDVRHAWTSIPSTDFRHRLDVITSNCGPLVRAEIKCMPALDQKDPEKVLAKICSRFGERRSTNELLQVLVGLHQHQNERVMEFSHRCQSAFVDLTQRQVALKEPVLPESMLINHFVRNVRDRQLYKFLKEKMVANPAWTFSQVREAALDWAEDDEMVGAASTNAITTTTAKHDPSEAMVVMMETIKEMKNQLEMLLSERTERKEAAERRKKNGGGRCFRCNKPGHFARDCRSGN